MAKGYWLLAFPFPLDEPKHHLEYLRTAAGMLPLTSGGCDNGTQWNRSLDTDLTCDGDLSYGSHTDRPWPD